MLLVALLESRVAPQVQNRVSGGGGGGSACSSGSLRRSRGRAAGARVCRRSRRARSASSRRPRPAFEDSSDALLAIAHGRFRKRQARGGGENNGDDDEATTTRRRRRREQRRSFQKKLELSLRFSCLLSRCAVEEEGTATSCTSCG